MGGGSNLNESWVCCDSHEEQHVHSVVQQIHPVVLQFLQGAPDLLRDPCLLGVEAVDGEELGVEVDHTGGDVHTADTGHVVSSVVAAEVRSTSDGVRLDETVCVEREELEGET